MCVMGCVFEGVYIMRMHSAVQSGEQGGWEQSHQSQHEARGVSVTDPTLCHHIIQTHTHTDVNARPGHSYTTQCPLTSQ